MFIDDDTNSVGFGKLLLGNEFEKWDLQFNVCLYKVLFRLRKCNKWTGWKEKLRMRWNVKFFLILELPDLWLVEWWDDDDLVVADWMLMPSFNNVESFWHRRRTFDVFLWIVSAIVPVRNASICWNIFHGCEICEFKIYFIRTVFNKIWLNVHLLACLWLDGSSSVRRFSFDLERLRSSL